MILHTQPAKPWTEHDFLLLEAYQILEEERCSQCGLPRYICHNESNIVQFRVNEDTCAAMVAKEKADEKHSKAKTPPKGTVLRPEPWTTDGSDFAQLRSPFYRAEAERLKATRVLPGSPLID